jgi:hypothetical protein
MNYLHPYLYTHYKLKRRGNYITQWEDNLSMSDWDLNMNWTELVKKRKKIHTNGACESIDELDPVERETMMALEDDYDEFDD